MISYILKHFKNILFASGGLILFFIGTAVGIRIVTEVVSPEVFGKYKLAMANISLLTSFLCNPLIGFLSRHIHGSNNTNDRYRFLGFMLKYVLLISVMIFTMLFLAGKLTGRINFRFYFFLLLFFSVQAVLLLHRSLSISLNNQFLASINRVFMGWLIPCSIALFVFFTKDTLNNVMTGALIGLLLVVLFVLLSEIRNHRYFNFFFHKCEKEFTGIFKYCIPLAFLGGAMWVISLADRYLINYFKDNASVGIYSAAYGIVSAPIQSIGGLAQILLTHFVFKANESGDKIKQKMLLHKALITTAILGFLAVLFIFVFGNYIARFLLAENYRQGAHYIMIWVSAGYAIYAVTLSFELNFYARRKTHLIAIASTIAALVNIVFNVIIIPGYGVSGAAFVTFLTFVSYFIVHFIMYLVLRPRNKVC